MDTTNLRQIAGGTVIKQADRSSTMSFILQDAIGREVDLDGQTAQVALYTLKGKYWETSTQVKGAIVSFSLPGNLSEDDYILDISVAGYVFPSDRDFIIRVVKGFRDLPTTERAERAKQTFEEIRDDVEKESEKRLKDQLEKIDERSESTIQAIEKDGQEYIKLIGTNKDNAIAEIEAKRQSSLQEINKKAELAIVDVSNQLKDYAKQKDVENFQTELSSAVSENFYTINKYVNGKADKNHTHTMNDVSGIKEEFRNVNTIMTSMNSVLDETITKIDKKANKSHTHSISDVSNLQTTLDNKAPKTHAHSQYITTNNADIKYLKKGEPIELTTQQKAELKGDPGKGIVDVKSGREIKIWIGDQSDYDSISTKDGDTLYLIWE